MHWLFAGLAGVGFVELLIRLPVFAILARFRGLLSKAVAIIVSRKISDHWKEKVLPTYALQLFKPTLSLAAYIALAFAPFRLFAALSATTGVPFMPFALSLTGMIFITIFSLGYAKVRSLHAATKL